MGMIYDCRGETRLFEISKQSLYYPMKKYSAAAGVPRIRIHDLRHSHAALLIEQGILSKHCFKPKMNRVFETFHS